MNTSHGTLPAVSPELDAGDQCWSTDEEFFNHETLQDLLDNHGDLQAGHVVYVGQAVRPKAEHLCDADDIIEMITNRAWDIAGEFAENYPDVTKEASLELEDLITSWVTKHCPPNFWTVKDVREYVLTDEDVRQPSDDVKESAFSPVMPAAMRAQLDEWRRNNHVPGEMGPSDFGEND